MAPDVFMIGGANGAGKTTAALELLPKFIDTYEFVNADEIARGLNPVKPETANMMAGRMMIERIDGLVQAKKSFAFETTCAGSHHKRTFEKCREAGYRLNLIFLWVSSADMAIERVAQRVEQGGHAIAKPVIRRRYIEGLQNLITIWLPMVDKALILDSRDDAQGSYPIIAEKAMNKFAVIDRDIWKQIETAIKESKT